MSKENKSNEIKITRVYDAPVATVWDAWTDPVKTAQWWGPRGFTLTTHSKDLRPGGHWNYTMHGPNGEDYENKTIYHEVQKHSKLVYDHGGNDDRPPLFRVTVLFTEVDGKTKMDMSMTLPTPEAAAETRTFIKKAGGNATWDRLAEYLEKESSGKENFVINRTFDAPIEVMFEMWTNPKHLAQWMGPTDCSLEYKKSDIKRGGKTFYVITDPDGTKMYLKDTYQKIERPFGLIFAQQFCDENENVSCHPYLTTWPETILTTVQLTEEDPHQTRVMVTWEPYGEATPGELETFINARGLMTRGWTESFDKLEANLPTLG